MNVITVKSEYATKKILTELILSLQHISRFWKRIKKLKNGCWEWTGTIQSTGYGSLWFKNKHRPVHRLSYLIHYKKIDDELFVLHKCDNPKCINPDHLFQGSCKTNVADMYQKGRKEIKYGERSVNNRLTFSTVKSVREFKGKLTQQATADLFSISQSHVCDIWAEKSWPSNKKLTA